ncbi:MAG: hypothetical protein ACRDIY_13205 [Chloroflexota bacterium]
MRIDMIVSKSATVTLDNLPELLAQMRRPLSRREVQQRRDLGKRVDRLREAIGPVATPLEEWMREDHDERDSAP